MATTSELRALADSYAVWSAAGSPIAGKTGVYDLVDDTLYEFPRHSYELLQRYRPWFARHPHPELIYTICDMIGPYQFLGRNIWFGATFPDAEGATDAETTG